KLTNDTDQAVWSEADLEQCSSWPTLPDSILGMENIPVTTENAEEIARHMLILTNQALSLSPRDLEVVVTKMSAIVEMATIYLPLAKDVVGIINNILNQTDDLTGFSVRILQIMETMGNNLEFMGTEVNITTDTVSMAVVNIDFIHFWGIAFGVLSYIDGFIQQVMGDGDGQRVGGAGGWSSSGCEVVISNSEYTTCYCNHLTHFGILLNISRKLIDPVHLWILTIISYIGCGISSLFLGVILLTYLAFE
ncbi:hypothetical protein chiPu_0021644, partial [Chiloscyllium punctatum]|nr:hypothetical protein [Chiloscyllium punctatum]